MSFGMGIMDNMIHTESSKVSSLSNGNGSDEKLVSSYNTDRMCRLKFKRRKVFAVRDFPPGCGTMAMRNVQPSSEAKVESGAKEEVNLGQQDDRFDEQKQLRNDDMDVESARVKMPEPEQETMKDGSDTEEKTSDGLRMVEPVDIQPLSINLPDDNCIVRSMEKNSVLERSGSDDSSSSGVENTVRDMVVYTDEQSLGREDSDQSLSDVSEPLERKKPSFAATPRPVHVAGRRKAKKGISLHTSVKLAKKTTIREYGESSRTKNSERNALYSRERVSPEMARHPKTLQVGIPPSRPNGTSGSDSIRNKVKETLRLFYGACRKLLQEQEKIPKKKGDKALRVDFKASKILKAQGKYLNTGKQILGTVPGIEVGDEFQYRMELNILGIHRPSQGGIDSMKDSDGELIATSVVASGGYDDEVDNTDILTYTGQGGNVIKLNKKGREEKEPEDQQLITGNLALANSIKKRNPVRVIRGNKNATLQSSSDAKGRTYVYDGLYTVEEFWQETGSHGKLVFKFKLKRIPGQPELWWKVVKKSKKLKYREGLCKLDIAEGRERFPISAVNEIDDEQPPVFTYTEKMIYSDRCRPSPPKPCGCTKRCLEARNCACVAKNGGEIPYNYDGAIVSAKTLIYECGPLCKCPASCYLRVAQRGIKFRLEIFKTAKRGWGVRSLNSIPSGSFICEYVGELLEDKEAERRTGNDEYLFDIGNRYDNSLAEGMSKLMPGKHMEEDDDEASSGFTIDAARKGNIGRFINHSCSPNLYAQNVLYDHEDTRIPHVMFFAMDNIPPLQELSYHYNYQVDQVRDSNGNIKKKDCHCGSSACTLRLY